MATEGGNVETLIKPGETLRDTLQAFQILLSKYQMMLKSLLNTQSHFANSLKGLDASLGAIARLAQPEELHYNFELGDTLYARAVIPAEDRKALLWLGAGVLVEYDLADARSFLEGKHAEHKEKLRRCEHDMEFIRKQITTTEVTIARLYNHAVRKQ